MLKSFFCFSILILLSRSQNLQIPEFKTGPITVLDETALSNPNSFDYEFSEDLSKPVDIEDLYDQFLEQLPMFNTFKLGKHRGITEVPIVTRKWETWFTPSTQSMRDDKFTFYSNTTPMTPKSTPPRKAHAKENAPTVTTVNKKVQKPKQPAAVFRVTTTTTLKPKLKNNGPIWRKNGIISSHSSTLPPITPTRQIKVFSTSRKAATTEKMTVTTTTTTSLPTTTRKWTSSTRQTLTTRWQRPNNPPQVTSTRKVPLTRVVDPISQSQPKPVVIHNPNNPKKYLGPTYNCRVLNPFTDGAPASDHDPSCKMLYPGLSLDRSCRCFYKVAGRDEKGCATGFVYSCRIYS